MIPVSSKRPCRKPPRLLPDALCQRSSFSFLRRSIFAHPKYAYAIWEHNLKRSYAFLDLFYNDRWIYNDIMSISSWFAYRAHPGVHYDQSFLSWRKIFGSTGLTVREFVDYPDKLLPLLYACKVGAKINAALCLRDKHVYVHSEITESDWSSHEIPCRSHPLRLASSTRSLGDSS